MQLGDIIQFKLQLDRDDFMVESGVLVGIGEEYADVDVADLEGCIQCVRVPREHIINSGGVE